MSSGRARLLIVDDNPDDLATYSRWLLACQERKLTVITASSSASALAIFETYKPDCILLDYDLGDSNGLEFMAELATRGLKTPIIAITGNGNEAIAVEFMKAGARDYFTKAGISAGELCSAVVAQLSPHTLRKQLALYRERERTINAELAQALERVSFLAETGKILAATLDYHELLRITGQRAVPFLGDACILDLVEDGSFHRRSVHVASDAAFDDARKSFATTSPVLHGSTGVARAMHDGTTVYVTGDALLEATHDDVDLAALTAAGLAAAAFFPLSFSGSALGVLTLGTKRPGGFTNLERSLCEDYAQRVAVAIANARIVEAERLARELAETAKRRLTFQSRISTLFAQSLDWENTLKKLMKLVTTSFSDSAVIFTIEPSTQSIRFVAAGSHSIELERAISQYFTAFPPLISDAVGIGRALRTGRSQFLSTDLFAQSTDALVSKRQRELIAAWAPISVISVPLHINGVDIGILALVRDFSLKRFSVEDVAVAEDVARRTAVYMENARLYEREHRIAWTLQQALLPSELPIVSDLLFGVRYFAGAEGMDVGGDWYDIVDLGERIVFTIGDVVGRGIKAAVAMGRYRDILRAYAFEGYGAAAALTRLNDLVHALRGEAFATCTIVVLDRRSRRMQYSSAGHPPSMLRLPDGTVRMLDGASSMPIGAWPTTEYIEKTLEMPIGATLVLYTDGLVETRRRSAAEGVDVLRVALRDAEHDIELTLDGALRDVAPDRSDDIAMLAVEMLPLQSATLKRWVFGRIDRATMHTIQTEFDAMLETRAGADSDLYAARLILGELLSNVVRHAPGSFRLELEWNGEYPELRLFDSGPGFALSGSFTVPDDILSMTGRGLFLISKLGRSFKIVPRASGGLATSVVLPVRDKSQDLEFALR